jgi:dolichol-phosphate mannosyltransferase
MPTFNEAQSLSETVRNLFAHAANVDLLIVDDNSPDGTGELADSLAAEDERITVLHRSNKGGLGAAYVAGFNFGAKRGYELLVEMDADGSHRGVDLPKLLAEAAANDLVIGSRYVSGGGSHGWSLHRRAISRLGNLYTSFILGAKIKDITAGFRVYRTSFVMPLLEGSAAHGYAFQVEMAWRSRLANGRIVEVPILFEERAHGNSKMSSAIVREALWLTTKWGLRRVFRLRP